LISAGKYKVEGNPFEPLSDEARAAFQARVDDYYRMFVDAVARYRGVSAAEVRSGFGEGRVVGAREAVRLGMADRIATLDEALSRLQGSSASKRPGAQAHYRRFFPG
jgi:ClpP class serine protease